MTRKKNLTKDEESLAVELYRSSNRDVDKIIAELWELQAQYKKARKMSEIRNIADKFEITSVTMTKILKRHGVARYECPTRIHLTK